MGLDEFFTQKSRVINLNAGTLAVVPDPILSAKIDHIQSYEMNPTLSLNSTWAKLWAVQKALADFLVAKAEDLFLRNNVTEALNDIILGFQMKSGQEILAADLEYGAILNICKLKAKREDLSLRLVPLFESLRSRGALGKPDAGELAVEFLLSQIESQTKMLLVSHVMSLNGLIIPIEKLAEETKKRGIILVVDGAHAIGSLNLDFSRFSDIDAYAGNLHKWMMAPKGSGFGWIRPRTQSEFHPTRGSWTVFETPQAQSEFGEGHRFASQMLLSSCLDFSSWFAIRETLDFWKEVGPEVIRDRVQTLKNKMRAGIQSLGWQELSPRDGSWGPLTSFATPEVLQKKYGSRIIQGLLQDYGIQIHAPISPQGASTIRFSPSIHNSDDEIERALHIFQKF